MPSSPIILIGPMCAGKSTIAELLAQKLGIKRLELDELRWDYYDEAGYDREVAAQIVNSEQGMMGLIRYWKPFEVHAVERAVAEHGDCVLDFGAGHTVHEDEALFQRVKQAFAPCERVILLLPSPELNESVEILNARFRELLEREVGEVDEELLRLNEHFVKHPSNRELAKMVVYTEGHTPEETCEEILEKMGHTGESGLITRGAKDQNPITQNKASE